MLRGVHRDSKQVGRWLHELDAVSLGVGDFEVPAAVAACGDRGGHRDAVRGEVLSHCFGVGGVVSGVIETIDGRGP